MEIEEFWRLLEVTARETSDPEQRLDWLEYKLVRIPPTDVVDFQIHLEAVRRPIDTYAMWGAANQLMDGLCSRNAFWHFLPWLIGQGPHWWQHAAQDPDNLVDLPAVRALAGRHPYQWATTEWPQWEGLATVAPRAYDRIIGREDSIDDALGARGHRRSSDPDPVDQPWDDDSLAEIERRLPRLASLFPRRQFFKP